MSMKLKKYLSYALLVLLFITMFTNWITLTPLYKTEIEGNSYNSNAESILDDLNAMVPSQSSGTTVERKMASAMEGFSDGALSPTDTLHLLDATNYAVGITKQYIDAKGYGEDTLSSEINDFNDAYTTVKVSYIVFLILYILMIVSIVLVIFMRLAKIKDYGYLQTIMTILMFVFFVVFMLRHHPCSPISPVIILPICSRLRHGRFLLCCFPSAARSSGKCMRTTASLTAKTPTARPSTT